jgi:diguanylate cyclase (GGDEF)-like protein
MAYSAAGIYAGAAAVGLLENAIPGGQTYSLIPGLAALVFAIGIVAFGRRLPRPVLALLGPLGAVLIGAALVDTRGFSDSAVFYTFPALWTAYFFGMRGTVGIVVWIGVVQAVALLAMAPGHASIDRWIDVEVAVGVVAVVVRVLASNSERLMRRLVSDAGIDPLTGLLNRRGFDARVHVEVARASREGSSLAVLTLDIDRFKSVNDIHGHEVGDRVLAWIGTVLTRHLRATDIAARFGGEEFVLVLPGTDAVAALTLGERLRRTVSEDVPLDGRAKFGISDALRLSVSGGVAAGDAPVDLQALLDAADQAMYTAKRNGRDRIVQAEAGHRSTRGDAVLLRT